jgi:hypothetical protein
VYAAPFELDCHSSTSHATRTHGSPATGDANLVSAWALPESFTAPGERTAPAVVDVVPTSRRYRCTQVVPW